MRQIRFLLAWMSREEAIATFLGRAALATDDVTDYVARWDGARQALSDREEFNLAAPILEELPPDLTDRANAFRQRPDVLSAFQGLDWTVGIANLNNVLGFQKTIAVDHAIDRVAVIEDNDFPSLFSISLPDPAPPMNLDFAADPDQKALTFSSPNPNLRLGGHMIQQVEVPAAPGQNAQTFSVAGFIIHHDAPFVQIAEFNGRWFVRDGYHRCFGFLSRGIRRIPCIFVRARSFEELGANKPVFVSPELLFGPKPPFLTDFLDDLLSAPTQHRDIRKILRVSAQEFMIQL